MKTTLFAFAATLMIATSASAGGFSFNLPNLDFPNPDTVTVGKNCLLSDAMAGLCTAQQ